MKLLVTGINENGELICRNIDNRYANGFHLYDCLVDIFVGEANLYLNIEDSDCKEYKDLVSKIIEIDNNFLIRNPVFLPNTARIVEELNQCHD